MEEEDLRCEQCCGPLCELCGGCLNRGDCSCHDFGENDDLETFLLNGYD